MLGPPSSQSLAGKEFCFLVLESVVDVFVKFHEATLATGKYGCTEVRVYPAECGEQLGRDP